LKRDRLASPGVIADGHQDEGDALSALGVDEAVELLDVHVALEGMEHMRMTPLLDDEVERPPGAVLDAGPCRVEVIVVRHGVAGMHRLGAEDLSAARP
jgi:hypothetical protein